MTDSDLAMRLDLVAQWLESIAAVERDVRNEASIGRVPKRQSRAVITRAGYVRDAARRLRVMFRGEAGPTQTGKKLW